MKKKGKKHSGGDKPKKRKRGLNFDKAKEKSAELDSRSDNEFQQLKQGANYFFLLPAWADDVDVIWHEVQQHGRGGVCPKKAKGKPCKVCKERSRRMKKGDSAFADRTKLRGRAFFNSIRKELVKEKDPSNVKVLPCSPTVFQEILDWITDEQTDPSDPNAAIPICIRRKGEGLKTRYKVRFGDPVDISKYITDEILDALWDLTKIRASQPMSEKEQIKLIRGDDGDGDDSDDDIDDEGGFSDSDLDNDGGDDDDDGDDSAEEDELFSDDDDDDDDGEGDDEDSDGDEDDEDSEDSEDSDEDDEGEDADELDGLLDDDDDDKPKKPKGKTKKPDKGETKKPGKVVKKKRKK